jgi:ketosteroid isomerase-like protein
MSEENLETVRRGYEHYIATGEFPTENFAPDFVWDLSQFRGWPEQPLYPGLDGARKFMRDWTEAWDDWEFEVTSVEAVGDRVVAVIRQHGRAKATGMEVDMIFGQVWSFRDGKQLRMEMYADPDEAFRAAGR